MAEVANPGKRAWPLRSDIDGRLDNAVASCALGQIEGFVRGAHHRWEISLLGRSREADANRNRRSGAAFTDDHRGSTQST
jgi:hypothetical protein